MTHVTELKQANTPRNGLARLWAQLSAAVRATSEATVRFTYDRPWLRDAR